MWTSTPPGTSGASGDLLRSWAKEDAQNGVDVLQRKYDWVREHLFGGLEFKKNGEPASSSLSPGASTLLGSVRPW